MLSADHELVLIRSAQGGDERAVVELVDAHRNMIRKIARNLGYNLDEEDAYAEGVAGFLRALPKFDADSGYRLNTYARHYVAEAIREASRRAPMIKLPISKQSRSEVQEARKIETHDGYISPEDLARRAEISLESANKAIMRIAHARKNVYAPINEALDVEDRELNPEDQMAILRNREILQRAMERLTDREKHIISVRTSAEDPLTLDELGKIYGVTRERIRQIENNALKKMRKELTRMGVTRQAA
jgi:RNA polymerase sigma factor (sigma-70 family)